MEEGRRDCQNRQMELHRRPCLMLALGAAPAAAQAVGPLRPGPNAHYAGLVEGAAAQGIRFPLTPTFDGWTANGDGHGLDGRCDGATAGATLRAE
jgi:hypothetical protein